MVSNQGWVFKSGFQTRVRFSNQSFKVRFQDRFQIRLRISDGFKPMFGCQIRLLRLILGFQSRISNEGFKHYLGFQIKVMALSLGFSLKKVMFLSLGFEFRF